jgi:hypothetical protein
MTPNRSHVAGLELALDLIDASGCDYMRLKDLIAQAKSAPAEPVGREAVSLSLLARFGQIEFEIMQGKHSAASVFTQMRTAAVYLAPPSPDAELVSLLREIHAVMRGYFPGANPLAHDQLMRRIDAKLASLREKP